MSGTGLRAIWTASPVAIAIDAGVIHSSPGQRRAKELKIKAKKEAAARAEATDDSHDANADMPELESAFYASVGMGSDDIPAPPAPAPEPEAEPEEA